MHANCIALRGLHSMRACARSTTIVVSPNRQRAANHDHACRTPEGFHRRQAAAAGSRQYSWLCGALAAPPKATTPCCPHAVSDRPEPCGVPPAPSLCSTQLSDAAAQQAGSHARRCDARKSATTLPVSICIEEHRQACLIAPATSDLPHTTGARQSNARHGYGADLCQSRRSCAAVCARSGRLRSTSACRPSRRRGRASAAAAPCAAPSAESPPATPRSLHMT